MSSAFSIAATRTARQATAPPVLSHSADQEEAPFGSTTSVQLRSSSLPPMALPALRALDPEGARPSTDHIAPQVVVASDTQVITTIEPPGGLWASARDELFLDQPCLFYNYSPYTGDMADEGGRSAYRQSVMYRTNVQITTTALHIMQVLGLQVSLSEPNYSDHPRYSDVVVTSAELRALYMKALDWFIQRECLSNEASHVAFVGGMDAQSAAQATPAISIQRLREMAEQLPAEYRDAASTDEFGQFMLYGGQFFVDVRRWGRACREAVLTIIGFVFFYIILVLVQKLVTQLLFS
ncbi:hypothetical protein C8T65DRAFT_745738 [Cerioporus squamosus]|nr:hypothetical protein C8T65DRAFT_745738 [Cerioporus squamosus]